MPTNRIVVIGGSAGGIETLQQVVRDLPKDFPTPICIVLHTSPQSPAVLAGILSRRSALPASNARNGERLRAGTIYVAPPDNHLLVEPGILRVAKGPRENRFRPAIDPLFRSAAQIYGPGAIGVILTGNLDDGAAGLWTIKQMGGTTIVQDPDDALFPSMPQMALEYGRPDHVVPASEIGKLLVQLVSQSVAESEPLPVPKQLEVEVKIAKDVNPREAGLEELGEPSSFACPECHGVLLQLKEAGRLRFRCHTGHAYSLDSLLADINDGIEASLWNAIRALEEGSMFMQGLAKHWTASHNGEEARRLQTQSEDAHRQSEILRKLASEREPLAKS